MQVSNFDIEQKIGESSSVIAKFEDDLSHKIVKMAKKANEVIKIQEREVAHKIQSMSDDYSREECIQTFILKQVLQQDEKDPQHYENKLNDLIHEFKSIQSENRESELMKLQHTESYKNIKTDKQIYEAYSTIATTPISNQQNGLISLRDKSQSFNKSMVSSITTNRNNYEDSQGWNNKEDNQKLCCGASSSNDLSQGQFQIASGLGLNKHSSKSSKFSQKLLKNNNNNNNASENPEHSQRQSTTTNTKLYIAFPEEQIDNPEYLKYDLKTRLRMQILRIGECLLILIIIIILYILYQYLLK